MEDEIKHVLTTFCKVVDELVHSAKKSIDHNNLARAARDWMELARLLAEQRSTPMTVTVNTGTEVLRNTIPADEQAMIHQKIAHAEHGLTEIRSHAEHKGVSAAITTLMKR